MFKNDSANCDSLRSIRNTPLLSAVLETSFSVTRIDPVHSLDIEFDAPLPPPKGSSSTLRNDRLAGRLSEHNIPGKR